MDTQQKVNIIITKLNDIYPNPPIPLHHINNFTLLVAVILSAQSTDKKVNELTPKLFRAAPNPYLMYNLGQLNIYNYIK